MLAAVDVQSALEWSAGACDRGNVRCARLQFTGSQERGRANAGSAAEKIATRDGCAHVHNICMTVASLASGKLSVSVTADNFAERCQPGGRRARA